MTTRCDKREPQQPPAPIPACCPASAQPCGGDPLDRFAKMIPNCLAYAAEQRELGRPIVGIMCEYTPRELILAAGAVPVCLCGGSADTIPEAEKHLPANLCPLIKSTYGYHLLGTNPFLEMASLVVGETTCDGKKKMFELMGERRPMYVLELPQKPDDPDAFEHWVRELRKFGTALEERFGTRITDVALRDAIALMNRERALRRSLAELMKRAAPPLTGRQLLGLKSSISGIPADLAQYEAILAAYGNGHDPRACVGKARVLMTGVPMPHGAERVLEIVEEAGGLVVCLENCSGVKPILEDVDGAAPDLIRALATKYFRMPCSVMTKNERRIELLRTLAREYRADCIVEVVWRACLTYDVESYRVRRLAEEELEIPYLQIEADYSLSDRARIQTRVEALLEGVRRPLWDL